MMVGFCQAGSSAILRRTKKRMWAPRRAMKAAGRGGAGEGQRLVAESWCLGQRAPLQCWRVDAGAPPRRLEAGKHGEEPHNSSHATHVCRA
jgi:hypothetical protein